MGITPNASPIYDYKRGFIIINWLNIPNANQGDPFEITGFLVASLDWQGTLGVGFSARLEGTNDPAGNPAVWGVLPNTTVTAAGLLIPSGTSSVGDYPIFCRYIRPNITAGDGTTNMSLRAMVVSQNPS